jgi:site-specific DNA-methyltransferase (adenine-specific)
MTLEKTLPVAPVQPFLPLPSLPLDQIILGDNCEVMRTLPSESIDLVVTSPPYDDLRTYSANKPMAELWDFYGVAWNLKRLLKPGGVIVWNVADATKDGDETGTSFQQALHFKSIGLRLHDTMIWDKGSFTGVGSTTVRYGPSTEFMFVFSKGKVATFNPLKDRKNINVGCDARASSVRERDGSMRPQVSLNREIQEYGIRFNVWKINPEMSNANRFHPGQMPEALARDHILSWSNEGDIVLDPFSGSGTTAKMAKHNGRRYIGIEVNPEYVEISQQRLAQGVLF